MYIPIVYFLLGFEKLQLPQCRNQREQRERSYSWSSDSECTPCRTSSGEPNALTLPVAVETRSKSCLDAKEGQCGGR
jgi:hypothetical protein